MGHDYLNLNNMRFFYIKDSYMLPNKSEVIVISYDSGKTQEMYPVFLKARYVLSAKYKRMLELLYK